MANKWEGIFSIPSTPFTDEQELDLESFVREIDWMLASGVQGIVYPVLVSEFFALDDEERRLVTRTLVERVAGRLPVVVGVSSISVQQSMKLAAYAQELHADAVIAMPPTQVSLSAPQVIEFFRRLAGSINMPVCLQNTPPPIASPIPVEACVELVKEVGNIRLIKEETPIFTHHINIMARQREHVDGIFGGLGGLFLPEELRRGATGNMPGAMFPDALAKFWARWKAGDIAGAEAIHARLLSMMVSESQLKTPSIKETLVARGIFRTATMRANMPALDDFDKSHLRESLARIDDLLVR